jgi:CRISPR-associated protein Cas2
MRRTILVTYDICEPKRLTKGYRTMRGYGDHLQLSVFLCQLTRREFVELQGRLEEIIHHDDDQVLFADLGPADGEGKNRIRSVGKKYVHPERAAIVL